VASVKENRLIYTEAFVNASKDDLIITIAKPVYSSAGVLRGVVAGDVSVRTVMKLVMEKKVGDQGFSFLLDSKKKMLAHPEYHLNLNAAVPDLREEDRQFANYASQELAGVVGYAMKGKEGFVAFRTIPQTSWVLGSFISIEEFINRDEQLKRGFALALTVSIVILFVLFVLLARLVVAPLSKLNASVRKINMETLSEYRVPIFGNDEISVVGKTINELLDKAEDYFAQKNANEEAIKQREARLQSIIKGTNVGTWEWNVTSGETVFDERWAEIAGYSLSELEPVSFETWRRLVHPDDFAEANRRLQEHFEGKTDFYRCDIRMKHKKGSWIWVYSCGQVLTRNEEGQPLKMMGTHTDITDRKLTEEAVLYLSYHDQLTGLYNRRFYEEELRRLDTKRNLPLSIIIGDVNGLKRINDTLGHEKGDELIKKAATAITQGCRADDIIARMGGDEFVVLLPRTPCADAVAIIQRIRELASKENVAGQAVSVSFGADTKYEENDSTQVVFQKAEKEMYRQKREEKIRQRKRQ
jgi:diguanylate cyclase (GGDEF)-like protein/PAS domain S-box-containing protein